MPKKTLAVSLTPEQMQAARGDSQSDRVAVWADLIKRLGTQHALASWRLAQSGRPEERILRSVADLNGLAAEAFRKGHYGLLFHPHS